MTGTTQPCLTSPTKIIIDPQGVVTSDSLLDGQLLSGSMNGKLINLMMLSGHDPTDAYGPAGFEFSLGDQPVATTQELWIQLFDNTGKTLTGKVRFDTFTDCDKNLVMIVFTKNR